MSATCPWCGAAREEGPSCPRCGANYAKAEAIKAHGRAGPATQAPAAESREAVSSAAAMTADAMTADAIIAKTRDVDDPGLELKLCIGALPVMLGLAFVFHAFGMGHFLQRTFLTMPVHELGHATTAWLCGYVGIPTLWKTLVPETRGLVAPVLLAGGLLLMMYRAWQSGRLSLVLLGGMALLLQAAGTLVISADTARMLFVFGGDGMGMVLATALMASFFFGKDTQLYKGALRWGFLTIGAAAYVDIFATWWAAWLDHADIPFGLQEGTGLSDASKLAQWYGWSQDQLVDRYLMTAVCCLVVLLAVYAWGVWQAWREADERGQGE